MKLPPIQINVCDNRKRNVVVKVLQNPFFKHLTKLFLTRAKCLCVGIRAGANRDFTPIGAVFEFLVDSSLHRFFNVSCQHVVLDIGVQC